MYVKWARKKIALLGQMFNDNFGIMEIVLKINEIIYVFNGKIRKVTMVVNAIIVLDYIVLNKQMFRWFPVLYSPRRS